MRVLILEDDLLIGLDLQGVVEAAEHTVIGPCTTLAAARASLAGRPDFALLDIDLPDGRSFGFADALRARRIPFAFVSASAPRDLPDGLRDALFIAKPYSDAAIRNALASPVRLAS